ncbi:MAG: hypothetical protein ACQCN5_01740 [Candidatus Bathyarchaeia archaeon]
MSTSQLMDVLEKQFVPDALVVDNLQKLAVKNKILLQFLTNLKIGGSLRVEQEKRFNLTVQAAGVLSGYLADFNYAFFKFVKPVMYVPADIDLLVSLEDSYGVVKKLESGGYRVVVEEPYCVTLVKDAVIVDVYVHPTIGGVVYLDGALLLKHVRSVEFNGLNIPALTSYAEALVVAAHAVYKEKLYTLNDYFTIKNWITPKSRQLAKELNCEKALDLILNLNAKIQHQQLNMPYSFPTPFWLTLLFQKACNDNLTRSTCPKFLQALADKRSGLQIASKLTRETY